MIKRVLQLVTVIAVGIGMLIAMGGASMADQEEDFVYTLAEGVATVMGYTGSGGDVVIPETLNGYPVTAIGQGAFLDNRSILSIVLPDSMESIGSWAFGNCYSLKSIDLGMHLIAIGDDAFVQCYALESIKLPATLSTLGDGVFFNCGRLTSLVVDDANRNFASVDSVLYNNAKTTLIFCPESKTGALTIPDGVASIGEKAFQRCSALTGISMPDSLTDIRDNAFAYCNALSTIKFSNNLKSIGDYSFLCCYGLKSISLPNSVRRIGKSAFTGCSYAEAIALPQGITSIADDTFSDCNSLTSFIIPESVKSIGNNAFMHCIKLQSISIPGNVTSVGEAAFADCNDLTTALIPTSVASVGDGVFLDCYNLESIVVDVNNPAYISVDGVLYNKAITDLIAYPGKKQGAFSLPSSVVTIRPSAIRGCRGLTSVTIPDSVMSIGQYAFADDYNLTNITLPHGITTLNRHVFMGCWNISEITIPDSVTTIGYGTFASCNLKHLILPDSVTSIGDYAFSGNIFLNNVVIPSSVTNIGEYAFDNELSMTRVYFSGPKPKMGAFVFDNAKDGFKIYYHIRQRNSWSGYTDYISQAYCVGTVNPLNGDKALEMYMPITNGHVSAPTAPQHPGYSFGGWYKETECRNAWNLSTDTVSDDIVFYAKWGYTVTFNPQNGAAAIKVYVDRNSVITVPSVPTRIGYSFAGWYKDSSCTDENRWRFDNDVVTANTTLYAKWIAYTYTVTFNSQGGSTVAKKTAPYNTTITAPAAPTRSGYVFQDWCKEAACKTAWNFAADRVKGNITLYAKWVSTTPMGVKAASASYNSVKVSWNAVPGASGYRVYRASSSAGKYTLVGTVAITSFTNTGLTAGTTYYYKVCSYAGASKVASAFSAVVSTRPVPAAPGSPKATPSTYNSIKVTWAAVSGVTKYEVRRATSSKGTYTVVGSTSSTSYINTKIATGATYYYKVRAYRLVGSTKVYGKYSATVTAKTSLATPGRVKAARASTSSIKVTWGAVAGTTKYEVLRCMTANGTYAAVGSTASTSFTNIGLTKGKTYYYKVRAYRMVGTKKVYSGYSAVVSARP